MLKVFKYTVPSDSRPHTFELQGKIVHVGTTAPGYPDLICFWAIHEDEVVPTKRTFRIYGTGDGLPPNVEHIGSVVTANGRLVWHLFELVGYNG